MREPPASPTETPAPGDLPAINLEAAFEQMAQGVVVFDRSGKSCHANAAAARILGRRLEDLYGPTATPLDLVDLGGREIPRRDQALARVLDSGVSVDDFTVGFTDADGRRQWLNGNVAPIKRQGAIVGAVATFSDVTRMRQATDALQSGETRHHQLVDALADGMFVAQDFGFVFLNPALGELLGQPHGTATGLSFRHVVPPENYAFWIERYIQRIGNGPEPQRRYETQFLHADGVSRIDVEIVATRTRYGDRSAVLGVVRDIRERMRVEQELAEYRSGLETLVSVRTAEHVAALAALRDSENKLRSSNIALAQAVRFTRDIADNLPVRIAYWDRGMRCRFVNRAYCSWYGKPSSELLGRAHQELFADRDVANRLSNLHAALAGRAQEFEHEHPDTDGELKRSLIHLIPDRQGDEVHGVLVLAIDITPQWKTQLALELLNEQLVTARDRAESAGRAKSTFLANMSHEIRTPMNAIIGLTHLLRRDISDGAQGERLARIAEAATHLLQIVDDVLDLSKIEADKFALQEANFDVQLMLHKVCAMFEAKSVAKGLELRIDAASLPRQASGDSTRISQALINLLDNAVKFTERGSIDVVGTVLEAGAAGTLLRFEVRDTGIGVAASKLDRLFTPFEQAEAATNRRFGGTGLGLALTRRLARLMGGDAGAVSELGRGSTFWLTVRVGVRKQQHAPPQMADAADFLRSAHANAQVLVVEDNAINREVAVSLLQAVGLSVDVAVDGQEAIDAFARREYALILMDLQMPGVDGLEATRAIRRLPRGDGVPIVAITANAFAEDRRRAIEAGMNDHLAKPVEPTLLYATLARWLGSSKNSAPQTTLEGLQRVEGLDVDRGVAFFAGRTEPYLKALASFVKLYGPDWPGLGGDDLAARRELHSSGSACASVGATELAKFAHRLLGHERASPAEAPAAIADAGLAGYAAQLSALSARIADRLADLGERVTDR